MTHLKPETRCACGCGGHTSRANKYLHGHNRRRHQRRDVLALLVNGSSPREIANCLGMTRSEIYRELRMEAKHYGIPGGVSLAVNLAVLLAYCDKVMQKKR